MCVEYVHLMVDDKIHSRAPAPGPIRMLMDGTSMVVHLLIRVCIYVYTYVYVIQWTCAHMRGSKQTHTRTHMHLSTSFTHAGNLCQVT